MKKTYVLILILLGLIISLSALKAVLYNMLSTSGIFVSKAESEISYYKTQNVVLSESILTASSLTNVSKKAKELGFTDEHILMVLKTSKSLAVGR